MDDQQAIRRLKGGDIGGLEFLVNRYQVKAVHTAFLITHDGPLAEDVAQETFVRIYQQIHQFNDQYSFEPYLMRSVINAALNAATRNSRLLPLEKDADIEGVSEMILRSGITENQVEYNQLKTDIDRALARLSPRQRTVIVQRYYLEMSEKEMAEALSLAPGTIKWLLNAARQRLRVLLGQMGVRNEIE